MHKYSFIISLWLFFSFAGIANAQMTLLTTTQLNTVCNGNPCTYNGPKILINEVMLTPSVGDGSIYGQGAGSIACWGEWIELYNPDICQSIDISCFFLGNNAPNDNNTSSKGGGFVIPPGTVVPPRGFVIIRGIAAPAVAPALLLQNGGKTIEIVVGNNLLSNICLEAGASRLWFPNAGGWFAFYDNNGVPQDAISWNVNINTQSCFSCVPCNPMLTGCGYTGALSSYDNFPPAKKNYITSSNPGDHIGQSFRRIPDGGNWVATAATPTYGNCNAVCIPPPNITCNGKALVVVSGGQPPYTYNWNDQQLTLTAAVTGLCAGTYTVTVKDAGNQTSTANVLIENMELNATIAATAIICIGGNNGSAGLSLNNGKSPYHYLWNNGDTTAAIHNLTAGNYTVAVRDSNDCRLDTSVVLTDSPVVLSVSVNNPTICSRNTVTLTATPSLPGGNFSWSPGGQQTAAIKVTPMTSSSYSVIYAIAGCVAKDTSMVTVNPSPLVRIHASSTTVMIEDSVVLFASGGLTYLWNNGYTTQSLIMYPHIDTFYCVIASNNNNCYDTACENIKVKGVSTLYVPNSFSPNGDGLNDLFFVFSTHIEKFHILIFNRWGNLLFEANDCMTGWDGRYLGEFVPEGLYVFSLEAMGEDKQSYRKLGTVNVLR